MKGDRVEIVIDAGGTSLTYEVTATRAGRRVETSIGRGVVEIAEVTRGGTVVRTARFMSSRVLALVEHPVARREAGDEIASPVAESALRTGARAADARATEGRRSRTGRPAAGRAAGRATGIDPVDVTSTGDGADGDAGVGHAG